jgi:hypothetical protein
METIQILKITYKKITSVSKQTFLWLLFFAQAFPVLNQPGLLDDIEQQSDQGAVSVDLSRVNSSKEKSKIRSKTMLIR